jgi:metal-sulfur cluster biosynthetic enzyme
MHRLSVDDSLIGVDGVQRLDDQRVHPVERDGLISVRTRLRPALHRERWVEQDDARRWYKRSPDADPAVATLWSMVTEDEVTEALANVIDPELGLDFIELGLVYDVEIDAGTVNVTFTLTTPACPIGPQVSEQMREFVGELEGVEEVVPTMVFDPPWTPEKMSEDAKFALGY